jgi:hypothetical protein
VAVVLGLVLLAAWGIRRDRLPPGPGGPRP